MPRLIPPLSTFQPATAGEHAEHQCLSLLNGGLPEGYAVFHHLGWHTAHHGQDHFGELDAVVVTPAGRVICLEIKAGAVDFSDAGIHKRYGGENKDVCAQLRRQHGALLASLRNAGFQNPVGHYLVLPQHRLDGAGSLSWPRDRIVDAEDYPNLPALLLRQDGAEPPAPPAELERLMQYLCGQFSIIRDVDASDQAEVALVRQLAGGLSAWVPRIESPSKAYLIEATAGSGKTQLALALLHEADARQERTLYVCFNRLLAEHIAQLAPARATVETFHQLCREVIERAGESVDFTQAGVFDELAQGFAAHVQQHGGRYDCIIIDEAQDFSIEWISSLLALGRDDHRLYILQDENQRLYAREPFELEGVTVIRSHENFRSPRQLVSLINLLGLSEQSVCACAPTEGDAPEIYTYPAGDGKALLRETSRAVEAFLKAGYKPEQIAVLSSIGKERSVLLAEGSLAGLSLKRFSGRYDRYGNPIWSEGKLLADTLFRFKGRSAAAVVLTEIDFESLDEKEKRRLFVGITRARRHLALVVSTRAEAALAASITACETA